MSLLSPSDAWLAEYIVKPTDETSVVVPSLYSLTIRHDEGTIQDTRF